jgi:hypothetical protein
MIRYAYNPETGDRFPIEFRPDCERTVCMLGDGETLVQVIKRLHAAGYQLYSRPKTIQMVHR